MTDWADEIAGAFLDQIDSDDLDNMETYGRLAAALRNAELRGRANGMGMAVKLLKEAENNLDKTKPGYWPNVGLLGNLEIIFGWEIDKIETASKLHPPT